MDHLTEAAVILEKALESTSETAAVDFKSAFNPSEKGELLEVVKDVVAMTNSGGGTILFGLNNDGTPAIRTSVPWLHLTRQN